jgi:hypothetical protein
MRGTAREAYQRVRVLSGRLMLFGSRVRVPPNSCWKAVTALSVAAFVAELPVWRFEGPTVDIHPSFKAR